MAPSDSSSGVPPATPEPFIGPYGQPCVLKTFDVQLRINSEHAVALIEWQRGNKEPLRALASAARDRILGRVAPGESP